jgi:uncharacterized protein YjgD (DUF1641 family)
MAKPIELMPKVPDAREELKRRVDAAPVEHADAVLSAYELLQELHESGVLTTLRGLVGAGDQVVRHAVGMATKPEAVNALRNLLIMGKVLGSIDPEILSRLTADLPASMQKPDENPPSLFAIFRRMSSQASRRALVFGVTILESVGNGLGKRKGRGA